MSNNYESAPQTTMLASNCACCARPLCDAESVEAGIGPECRQKHGYAIVVSPEARQAANKLVHQIAVEQTSAEVPSLINDLRALGFEKLAARVAKRVCKITVLVEGETLVVKAPYSEESVAELRRVPGRRWDATQKVNTFPVSSKGALWTALRKCYPGVAAEGPAGVFAIPA